MHIEKVIIKNIRSIEAFEMNFADNCSGWHVIIGDNGSGKSNVIRSISLALVGKQEALGLGQNWGDWLRSSQREGSIELVIHKSYEFDSYEGKGREPKNQRVNAKLFFNFTDTAHGAPIKTVNLSDNTKSKSGLNPERFIWSNAWGWFSAAYGPFRRFTGGDRDWDKKLYSTRKAAAHLTVYSESPSLAESVDWLIKLHHKFRDELEEGKNLKHVIDFINKSQLLPYGSKIEQVNSNGVFFRDGFGTLVALTELSDGYRSILSLVFDLIWHMVSTYGGDVVFREIKLGGEIIPIHGVVLIDEIDAHLHPTWQIRIGQWFTKHFPNIQFIVTTHSPLICRAAEKGSIWRLAAPQNEVKSGPVSDIDKQKLIYGNVLDAYDTEVFGKKISISPESVGKREELITLSNLKMAGANLSPEQENELQELRKIFATDDPIDL